MPGQREGQEQKNKDDSDRKNDSDKALGEHTEGTGDSKAPCSCARRLGLLKGDPEHEHGEREPQANDHVGNEDAGVDEEAEGGEKDQSGIEPGCVGGEKEGEPGGPILWTKEGEARSHAPVQERSLFEIADAVGVESDPVMTLDHF